MRRFLPISMLWLTGVPAVLNAQTDSAAVLDPITITSALQPQIASKTGRNIVTIAGSNFNKLPVSSVDELLRYVPGVEVQMRGPAGAQSNIVLRGGTFQQVLVLIDGVRLNDPITGHFNTYIPISPAEIDRIEILKGASSAIYGAEAVGGVVHVITKTFNKSTPPYQLDVNGKISAGSYGLLNSNIGFFTQKGNTKVAGGWLRTYTNGQEQRGTKGFVNNNSVSLSASHQFNKNWNLAVRAAYDNRDFAAQNFFTTFLSDTATEEVRSKWIQAALTYEKGKHTITLTSAYKNASDDYWYNKSSVANNNKSKLLQSTLLDKWSLSDKTTLTSGIQFLHKSIRSNDRGNHELPMLGAFMVLNHSFNEQLNISPAIRLDWNERSGTELIPQINASYRLSQWQLRASVGKTIREADFTERFNNYNKELVTGGSVGDPNLKAERSWSYEAGADYFPLPGLKLSTTLFQRSQQRLIDYITTPYDNMPRKDNLLPTGSFALATNIAKVNTRGLELDIRYQTIDQQNSSLQLGAGIVWMKSESNNAVKSFYLSSHAKLLSNLYAEYNYKNLQLSITGIYKLRNSNTAAAIDAHLSKEYWLLNAKAGYSFYKKKAQVFFQVDNIADKKYSDLLGAVMPGRWLSGGISFQINK